MIDDTMALAPVTSAEIRDDLGRLEDMYVTKAQGNKFCVDTAKVVCLLTAISGVGGAGLMVTPTLPLWAAGLGLYSIAVGAQQLLNGRANLVPFTHKRFTDYLDGITYQVGRRQGSIPDHVRLETRTPYWYHYLVGTEDKVRYLLAGEWQPICLPYLELFDKPEEIERNFLLIAGWLTRMPRVADYVENTEMIERDSHGGYGVGKGAFILWARDEITRLYATRSGVDVPERFDDRQDLLRAQRKQIDIQVQEALPSADDSTSYEVDYEDVIDAVTSPTPTQPSARPTPAAPPKLNLINLPSKTVPTDPEELLDWLASKGLPLRLLVRQALVVFSGPSQSGKSTLAHMVNVLRIYYGIPIVYISPDTDVPTMPYDQAVIGGLDESAEALGELANYLHTADKGVPEVGITFDEVLKVNKHESGAGQRFIGEVIEKGAKASAYTTLIGQAKTLKAWGVEGLRDAINDSAFLIEPEHSTDSFGKRTPKGVYRVTSASGVEKWTLPAVMLEEDGDPVAWLAKRLGVPYTAFKPVVPEHKLNAKLPVVGDSYKDLAPKGKLEQIELSVEAPLGKPMMVECEVPVEPNKTERKYSPAIVSCADEIWERLTASERVVFSKLRQRFKRFADLDDTERQLVLDYLVEFDLAEVDEYSVTKIDF